LPSKTEVDPVSETESFRNDGRWKDP
jgi:hypothetical protein